MMPLGLRSTGSLGMDLSCGSCRQRFSLYWLASRSTTTYFWYVAVLFTPGPNCSVTCTDTTSYLSQVGRIVESRELGFSTRDSIIDGVVDTGTVITAAGVIMSLAFFGLLLSDILLLNQMSFFLLFAVLFDTFIVRTLVVPSMMFWLGEANWWPRKMPTTESAYGLI
eukprot:m.95382 g.95382  ORF g.95382 m.95382 type:complete len:167 (+) comp12328_c0_seq1:2299-2799(+)